MSERGRLTARYGVTCARCEAGRGDLPSFINDAANTIKADGWRKLVDGWCCGVCVTAYRQAMIVTGAQVGRRARRRASAPMPPQTATEST